MLKDEVDYIINPMSDREYQIHKFLCGTLKQTYKITYEHDKTPFCNCPSGIYRGRCKHKEWVHSFKNKEALPTEVSVAEDVTQEGLNELFEMIKD